VLPRTRDEIKTLPKDWQALYLNSKPGVITEAFINYGAFPTEDELYTSEVFYSVSAGIGHDFRLLLGYLGRLPGLFFIVHTIAARPACGDSAQGRNRNNQYSITCPILLL